MRTVPFHCSFTIEKVDLPEPEGDPITIQKKVYVPCKEHPDYLQYFKLSAIFFTGRYIWISLPLAGILVVHIE